MRKSLKIVKRLGLLIVCMALALAVIFAAGRYGWKLFGFQACESAGIEEVTVSEGSVKLRGFYPGSFPEGFIGYQAEQIGETLYIGVRFSALFGIFETGDFDITVPTSGSVKEIYLKSNTDERCIWSEKSEEEAMLEAYATVIGEYKTAVDESWNAEQLMSVELNYMIAEYCRYASEPQLGYAVTDIDKDGVAELLLGAMAEDEFYGKMIFSLYTLDENGMPVLVFDSMERNRYYYAGDNLFANLGASSADSDFVTTLRYETGEMIDMTYTTEAEDYVQMEMMPMSEW